MHCRHRKSDSHQSFCVGLAGCANKMPKKHIIYCISLFTKVCAWSICVSCFKYLDLAIITNATHQLFIENTSQSVHSLINLISVPGTSLYWYIWHELHILYSVPRAVLAHPAFRYFHSHWAVQYQISTLIYKHVLMKSIKK